MHRILLGAFIFVTFACASLPKEMAHLPMYGGMDRQSIPAFKAADEQLIQGSTRAFGSRADASEVSVEQGFKFADQSEYSMAMKRFNQAWVLNQDNPRVYWGFGTILLKQQKFCDGLRMMERALSYNVYITRFYPQAAMAYTLCGASDTTLLAETKASYFSKSRELYESAAAKDTDKAHVYGLWAMALTLQGDYRQAWEKVVKQKEAGGTPTDELLSELRAKMPQ